MKQRVGSRALLDKFAEEEASGVIEAYPGLKEDIEMVEVRETEDSDPQIEITF